MEKRLTNSQMKMIDLGLELNDLALLQENFQKEILQIKAVAKLSKSNAPQSNNSKLNVSTSSANSHNNNNNNVNG
jgi:hypothetical protein